MLTSKILLTVISVALAYGANAQDRRQGRQPIDPTVSNIDSSGFWEATGQRGFYRAVTYRNCPDDCHYSMVIEWLSESPLRVVARKPISEVGDLTVVTDVRFVLSKAGTKLQIRNEKDGVGKWVQCLRLGPPGRYTAREGECDAGEPAAASRRTAGRSD
jgi:hypothetical protein